MSRRTTPAADRAAQNQQTIKALLKLEGNKICADCKRNKHPRWASWNLGVFVCIRCSGIHRGMGTHISRVKSVDLDSWTDEQLQSVLKWGNSRANKYWEAKLAPGHVPAETKIENFIRTKYDSKRWVMDGPMPDPSTLDADGDDDVPLNIVQEKAKIDRSTSQRISSAPQQQKLPPPQQRRPATNIDLFGDDNPTPPIRPSTADLPASRTAPKPSVQSVQRETKPGDSLLGLDFFGAPQPADAGRPSSATSSSMNSTITSRPDLKQSILSLYSSAPKPQHPPQPSSHNRQPSFGGLSSPTGQHDAFSGLTDAFSGLTFPTSGSNTSPPLRQAPAPSTFSGLGNFNSTVAPKSTPAAPQVISPPLLSGGSFFDNISSNPISQPRKPTAPVRAPSNGLSFASSQAAPTISKSAVLPAPKDLFASDDFAGFAVASPGPPPVPPPTTVLSPLPKASLDSAFNLSAPTVSAVDSKTSAAKLTPIISQTSNTMFDPWSSGNASDAWGAPNSPPTKSKAPSVDIGKPPSHITPNDISGAWGAPISTSNNAIHSPTVTADEDFGGWTSASTTQTPASGPTRASGGFGGPSDPFDNPWG